MLATSIKLRCYPYCFWLRQFFCNEKVNVTVFVWHNNYTFKMFFNGIPTVVPSLLNTIIINRLYFNNPI